MPTEIEVSIDFAVRTVIVTGPGNGPSRIYAQKLANLDADVVVNDYMSSPEDRGLSAVVADHVTQETKNAGGKAEANHNIRTPLADRDRRGLRWWYGPWNEPSSAEEIAAHTNLIDNVGEFHEYRTIHEVRAVEGKVHR